MEIKACFPIGVCSVVALYGISALNSLCIEPIVNNYNAWIMAWLFASVLACLIYLFKINERKLEDGLATITGIVYVGYFFHHLALIGMMDAMHLFVWMVMITAFVTDTAAYFSGVFLGKHKMTPVISPKKTWEGASFTA